MQPVALAIITFCPSALQTCLTAKASPQPMHARCPGAKRSFLDINLGEGKVDGIETLKMIKKIKPKQVVYMNTGYPVDDKDEKIIEKHALGILHKPFRIPRLTKTIKNILKI